MPEDRRKPRAVVLPMGEEEKQARRNMGEGSKIEKGRGHKTDKRQVAVQIKLKLFKKPVFGVWAKGY